MHATALTPESADTVATQSSAPAKPASPDAIEAAILSLTAARGADKSICPSEVARALLPGPAQDGARGGWQSLLTPVRQAAIRLARAGRIDILRKGRAVAPEEVRGVIRLRIKSEPA